MRPRALDLFCGAGGATAGLQRAGFEVIGIDHNPRRAKRYCGHFICADALAPPVRLADYDLIWASPPCQRYTNIWLGQEYMRDRYPNLIPATRALLQSSGVPWVIENVPGAPLRADVVLTGAVFGLDIVRKRLFEVQGFEPPFILLQEHFQKTVSNGDLACVAGQGANNAWNVRRKADKRKRLHRPRGKPSNRPSPDRGTPEYQARRIALVGSVHDQRAEYPLGVLLARGAITQDQHDAGQRYARLWGKCVGNPLTRGGRGYADPLDDDTQAVVEARWREVAHLLRRTGCKSIVDTICVYERMVPRTRLGRLKDGLDILGRFFLTGGTDAE